MLDAVARPAADKQQRNAGVLDQLRPRCAARAVARRHVRDLVGHHARQFGLVLGQLDQAGVDVEVAAGQRERVDLVGVDHLDRERHLGIGTVDDVLPDAVDVLCDHWIVDDLGILLDVGSQLLADPNLLFEAVEVDSLADFAVADLGDILLVVLGLAFAFRHRLAHLGRADRRCQQEQCRGETGLGECALHRGPRTSRMVPRVCVKSDGRGRNRVAAGELLA